ncbi:hypothetical protein ACHAXT_011657 [Thalassiosira profunda]
MQHGLLAAAVLSVALVGGAAAFAFGPSRRQDTAISRGDPDAKHKPEPNFHVAAQRIGKTVLRPGGSEATRELQEMANISAGDTVLELSAGLGRSGIELAQRYGSKVTVTDIDTSRLEKATEYANKLGVSDLLTVQKGSRSRCNVDVAQTEASLTHYPRSRKAAFFNGVARHADKFLLHEVYFKTGTDEVLQESAKKDLSKALNIGFVPETKEMWQKLLTDAGFSRIEHVATGDLAVLDPLSVIKDEGWGIAKIAFNLATQPYLRSRMLVTRKEMTKHASDLGYITIVASK